MVYSYMLDISLIISVYKEIPAGKKSMMLLHHSWNEIYLSYKFTCMQKKILDQERAQFSDLYIIITATKHLH